MLEFYLGNNYARTLVLSFPLQGIDNYRLFIFSVATSIVEAFQLADAIRSKIKTHNSCIHKRDVYPSEWHTFYRF